MNTVVFSLLAALGIPAAITFAYITTLNTSPLITWLVAANLMLLALLGKDKFAAKSKASRTPELTLLTLTFLGATPAMLIGAKLFKHKTKKAEFLYMLIGTITAQLACIYFFRTLLLSLL